MIEIVWRLDREVLDSEREMGLLLEAIGEVPGFEAAFYDVNGRDQWRGYEGGHVLVDALTQRTQWLRIAGADRESLALVAMGKHGEVPSMMMQLGGVGVEGMDALTVGWGAMFEEVGVAVGTVSSGAWRAALAEAGVVCGEGGLAMVQAWGEGALPENLAALLEVVDGCGAMRRYRRGMLEVLVLGDEERIVDDEHAVALGKMCALMSGSGVVCL